MKDVRYISEKNCFETEVLAPNSDKKYTVVLDEKERNLTLFDAQTQEKNATTKLSSYFPDKYADLTDEQLGIAQIALQKMELLAAQRIENAQKDIFYEVKGSDNTPSVKLSIIPEHLSGLNKSDSNDVYSLSADEIIANRATVSYKDKETGQNLQIDFVFDGNISKSVANIYRQRYNEEKELLMSFRQYDRLQEDQGASFAYIKNVLPSQEWDACENVSWEEAKKMEKIVKKAAQDVVSAVQQIAPALNNRNEKFITHSQIKGYQKTIIEAQKQRADDYEKDTLLRPKTGLLEQKPQVKLNYKETEYTEMSGEPNITSAEILFKDKGGNAAFKNEFIVRIGYRNEKGDDKLVADIYSQSNIRSNKLGKLLGNSVRNLSRKHLGSAEVSLGKNLLHNNFDSLPMEEFEKLLQKTKFKSDIPAVQQIVGFARKQILAELPVFAQQYEHQKGLQKALELEGKTDKNDITKQKASSNRNIEISM